MDDVTGEGFDTLAIARAGVEVIASGFFVVQADIPITATTHGNLKCIA